MPAVKGGVVFKGPAPKGPAPTPPVKPSKPILPPPPGVIKTQQTEPTPKVTPPPVTGPPIPVLVKAKNYFGSIQDVNARAQAVQDAHLKAYGTPAPPGLALDVIASPLEAHQFPALFGVPKDPFAAKNTGVVNSQPAKDTLVTRHDGYVEQSHPVNYALLAHDGQLGPQPAIQPEAQPSKTLAAYQALQKSHPWVAMGMLPIGSSLTNDFWNAVGYAQDHPGDVKPLTVGGETLAQYNKQNDIGVQAGQLGKPLSLLSTAEGKMNVSFGVTTVKAAQDQLKLMAPDFFQSLPSSGFVNSDWAKAIGKYQTSSLYFQQQTTKLAQDNHFGSNKAAFIGAWKTKQDLIKKEPFLSTLIAHQPLAFFDNKTHGKALAELLSGNAKGWGWANIPTIGLNALTAVGGLALNEISGTVDQAKQDSAFVTAYMQTIAPKWVMFPGGGQGQGGTEAEARAFAMKTLKEHPSWARVLDPNFQKDWRESKVTGQIANTAIDFWLGSAKLTGEKVAAGDTAAFAASPYVNKSLEWAYNSLKKGDLGGAVKTLGQGRGSEDLAVALEDGVKNGDVSFAQFRQHANDLYSKGHTTVGDSELTDASGLFRTLRTKDLPTPKRMSMQFKAFRAKMSDLNDQFEESLRARKQGQGATSHAVDYVTSMRQAFARANPAGESRALFDTRTPEDVFNYARVQLGSSPAEARALRDEMIRLRSAENIQGLSDFGDKLRDLYMKKNPGADLGGTPLESSGPSIESESLHTLSFPKTIETRVGKINNGLNKLGRLHRQTIVSGSPIFGLPIPGGGESLFWKHVVADTTRRIVGGGGFLTFDKEGKAIVDDFLTSNPASIRDVGVARSSSIQGETRYITGQKAADPLSFNTGDPIPIIKGKPARSSAVLKAAGGYLRNNLTSDALKAYQVSTKDDLQPLVELVMGNRFYRSQLDKVVAREQEKNPLFNLNPAESVADKAHLYAEMLFNRFGEIENAGKAAGVPDPLNEALDVLVKNVGPKADAELGHWLEDNHINLPVREGMVEQRQFDDMAAWWIGKLMTANKWNRGKLFDHVFYGTVKDLTNAGWDTAQALPVAADLAKNQTIYHMLDFSNMMQVEQNLRWLSYFATKHRLYWKWIISTAIHRPGLALVVNDVAKHLDSKGNLPLTLFGHKLQVPAERLFWVNSTDVPQTSPLIQFGAEAVKASVEGQGPTAAFNTAYGSLTSTSGNLFTRDDQAEMYGAKLALVASGRLKANSDAVTLGMTADQKRLFQEQVNEYSSFYRQEHGVYPSEQDAVKHTLIAQTAVSFWNTNLPLPVTPVTARSSKLTKMMDTYGAILDPVKKRAFLEAHPEVGLQFGVSQDPTVYLHTNQLWDKFNAAYAQIRDQRVAIYQKILKGGYTPAIKLEMKQLSTKWTATIDNLKLEDATTWHGTSEFPAGKTSDGQVVTPGPWTIQLSGDPLAARAFVHQSFPEIKPEELNSHTVGQRILDLQQRAAQIRKVTTDKQAQVWGYPTLQAAHDELTSINQQLAPFFAYPTDAAAQLQSEYYQKFVGPYIKERDKLTAETLNASSDNLDQVKSQLRAWKDQHDHPVYIMQDGKKIKFPSVVQIGWATLPPAQKRLALQQAAGGDWAHIASYEKTMLGIKTPPDVGEGWSEYYKAVTAYNKVPGNKSLVAAQRSGLAKQIDKVYPGFYKDYLFAQQPKVDRFKYTQLYKSMPDRAVFDEYITGPAEQLAKAIQKNGNRNYYEKSWRNYVETQVVPWLDSQPQLKKDIAGYGPNFLNTLPSVSAN